MEYVQAVNSVLLYGSILIQSCGENNEKKVRIVEAVNGVLSEMSDWVINQKLVWSDNALNKSLQKLMNIK